MNKSDAMFREMTMIERAPQRTISGEVPSSPPHEIIRFGGRLLMFQSPDRAVTAWRQLGLRFAALLPAFELADLQDIDSEVRQLLNLGCREFATVGPFAEELHDMIDDLVVFSGDADRAITTTWHDDPIDAAYYFGASRGWRGPRHEPARIRRSAQWARGDDSERDSQSGLGNSRSQRPNCRTTGKP